MLRRALSVRDALALGLGSAVARAHAGLRGQRDGRRCGKRDAHVFLHLLAAAVAVAELQPLPRGRNALEHAGLHLHAAVPPAARHLRRPEQPGFLPVPLPALSANLLVHQDALGDGERHTLGAAHVQPNDVALGLGKLKR